MTNLDIITLKKFCLDIADNKLGTSASIMDLITEADKLFTWLQTDQYADEISDCAELDVKNEY